MKSLLSSLSYFSQTNLQKLFHKIIFFALVVYCKNFNIICISRSRSWVKKIWLRLQPKNLALTGSGNPALKKIGFVLLEYAWRQVNSMLWW